MTRRRNRNRNCNRNRNRDPEPGPDPDRHPNPDPNLIARRVHPKGPTKLLREHGEGALLDGFLTVQGAVDLGRVGG